MITEASQALRDKIRSGEISTCGRPECGCHRCMEWRWAVGQVYALEREAP